MATSGENDLRGLNIDKISKDLFEEALIFKNEVVTQRTGSREIRWYQKTSGYLVTTAPAKISAIAYGARPFVLRQSWTRNQSFTKKYMLDSEVINMEDETDSDVQVFMNNAEDLTEAVANDLDGDIWDVATEDQTPVLINSVTTKAAWNATSGQDPYLDVSAAERKIRQQTKKKNPNMVLYLNALNYDSLKVWLVSTKGSSIPGFSSQLVNDMTLISFDAKRIVISENVTADFALLAILDRSVIYKEFTPMTTDIIGGKGSDLSGIGRKIRIWTNGIALLVRPAYNTLIINTDL
jgi:hypothetical protein